MRYAVYKFKIKEDCGMCLYESGELLFTNGDSVKIRSREEFSTILQTCNDYNFLDAIYVIDLEAFKLVHEHVINIAYDITHMIKIKDIDIEIRDLQSLNPKIHEEDAVDEVKNHLIMNKNRKVPIAIAGYPTRAFRTVCLNSYQWWKYFNESKLWYANYQTAYYANKAGYVQPNYVDFKIGKIIHNVYKWDAKSFYPAQMRKRTFPLGPIYDYDDNVTLVDLIRDSKLDYTVFCRLKIKKMVIKPGVSMPILKKDDLVFSENESYYGNAVTYAENVALCVHNITLKWILKQYILEGVEVKCAFRQVNLPLPKEVTDLIDKFFTNKCEIGQKKVNGQFENSLDQLTYDIYKVMINSGCFGIWCHDPLKYERKTLNMRNIPEVNEALDKWYNNSHTYTIYQLGIMICGYALDEIFTLMEEVGYENVVYACVDSIAVKGKEANEIIEDYNNELKKTAPYIKVNGKKEIYGEFEQELDNDDMVVLGANCYAFTHKGKLYTKISGIPDSGCIKGDNFIMNMTREEEVGTLKNFKPNLKFKVCTPVVKEKIPFGYREVKKDAITIKENMSVVG